MKKLLLLLLPLLSCSNSINNTNDDIIYTNGQKVCYTIDSYSFPIILQEDLTQELLSVKAITLDSSFIMANTNFIQDLFYCQGQL